MAYKSTENCYGISNKHPDVLEHLGADLSEIEKNKEKDAREAKAFISMDALKRVELKVDEHNRAMPDSTRWIKNNRVHATEYNSTIPEYNKWVEDTNRTSKTVDRMLGFLGKIVDKLLPGLKNKPMEKREPMLEFSAKKVVDELLKKSSEVQGFTSKGFTPDREADTNFTINKIVDCDEVHNKLNISEQVSVGFVKKLVENGIIKPNSFLSEEISKAELAAANRVRK